LIQLGILGCPTHVAQTQGLQACLEIDPSNSPSPKKMAWQFLGRIACN
jgi:hypothetical protein